MIIWCQQLLELALLLDRNDVVLLRDAGVDQIDDILLEADLGEVDEGQLVLAAEGLRDVRLRDHVQVDECLAEARSGAPGVGQGILDLFRRDDFVMERKRLCERTLKK